MQNVIEKPYGSPVVFNIEFKKVTDDDLESLANFSKITLELGSENYATDTTPTKLFIDPSNVKRLILKIGDTTELTKGSYPPIIIGYSATYPKGYPLTTVNNAKLKPIYVY